MQIIPLQPVFKQAFNNIKINAFLSGALGQIKIRFLMRLSAFERLFLYFKRLIFIFKRLFVLVISWVGDKLNFTRIA
jgi:hypothetical protein